MLGLLDGSLHNFSYWYVAGLAITGYLSYYFHEVVQSPILACGKGKYREFLENNVPILQERYWPTFWCWESRLQTVLGHYIRQLVIPAQPYRREILTMPDSGQVALDWLDDNIEPNAPILVALPGLTGCSSVEYMQNIALTMNQAGIRCVVFNNRGLGGLQLKVRLLTKNGFLSDRSIVATFADKGVRVKQDVVDLLWVTDIQLSTPLAYCATYVEDISEVVRHVRGKYPKSPIAVLGVSMGGLIVGNYISNKGEEAHSLLAAAVLISPPWNVFVGTDNIERPILNNILNRKLANNLVDTFQRCRYLWEDSESVDCNAVTKSRSVKEFDTNFTSKVFGFRDISDYYTNASIHEKIPKFRVPTLCLSAADDPFQPLYGIPVDAANSSQNVAIVIPSRGGHIGFMEGILPLSSNQYMQRVVSQYLKAILFDGNYANFKPT